MATSEWLEDFRKVQSVLRKARDESEPWLYQNVETSQEIETVTSSDFDNDESNKVSGLSEFKTIGSYNWSTESKPHRPVIIVPGSPNILESISRKRLLVKHKTEHFVDENRYQQPDYPLETVIRSVQLCSPEFNLSKDTDIVTDRKNLAKLIDFTNGKVKEPFRIDIQRVGNLVLFIRKDEKLKITCDDYASDFKDKYTSSVHDGSHHRIVSYTLGSVRLVVRFEVDCAELCDEPRTQRRVPSDINSLASYLSEIRINRPAARSSPTAAKSFTETSRLKYIEDGQLDKSAKLIELATKSMSRVMKDYPDKKINQMLVSHTDSLVLGWHQRGNLVEIERLSLEQLNEKCNRRDKDIENVLSKLSSLLAKLIEIAKSQESGTTLSVITGMKSNHEHILKVYKLKEEKQNLPDDLVKYLKQTRSSQTDQE